MDIDIQKITKLVNKINENDEKTDAIVYDKYILMIALADEVKKICVAKLGKEGEDDC